MVQSNTDDPDDEIWSERTRADPPEVLHVWHSPENFGMPIDRIVRRNELQICEPRIPHDVQMPHVPSRPAKISRIAVRWRRTCGRGRDSSTRGPVGNAIPIATRYIARLCSRGVR